MILIASSLRDSLAESNTWPVRLYELGNDPTIYFTDSDVPVQWNGHKYLPRGVSYSKVKQKLGIETASATVTVDNIEDDMIAWALTSDPTGFYSKCYKGLTIGLLDWEGSLLLSGAPQHGPTTWLNFDGTDDRVHLGDIAPTTFDNANNPFTIEGWINIDPAVTGVRTMFGKWTGIKGVTYEIDSSGFPRLAFVNSSGQLTVRSATSVKNGQMTHVAVSYDGSKTVVGFRHYADSLLQDNSTVIATLTANDVDAGVNAAFGAARGTLSGFNWFNGHMAEWRIWNYVRSQAQIERNRYKRIPYGRAGLIGYFKMDENGGSTAHDRQTNGTTFDGTIDGATWGSEAYQTYNNGAIKLFNGRNTSMKADTEFELIVKSDLDLHRQLAPRSTQDVTCRFRGINGFKGTNCGYAGTETACNYTEKRCRELSNFARFGGYPTLNTNSNS